jgi:hypothetical protein
LRAPLAEKCFGSCIAFPIEFEFDFLLEQQLSCYGITLPVTSATKGMPGHAARETLSEFEFNQSRAELSNSDVDASSVSPERLPAAMSVEVGSDISDGEWLCCVRQ